ncbi:M24 family metallopeptidase C-terminal domain-containing protein [Candidatus Lokiarchaeum ossiferum]
MFEGFYRFETFILCPFDLELIEPSLLDFEEKKLLNGYHKLVCKSLKHFFLPLSKNG